MKPVNFVYFDPATTDEAVALLARYGEDAKLLAGGQSLIPLMNFRLARPKVIIDINRIEALDYIQEEDGSLRIGALTRDRTVETSPLVREKCPFLVRASSLVGHLQIRNRSTIGGASAQADPAGEVIAALKGLDAIFVIRGSGGERTERAEDFFVTYLTTALDPTEMITEVRVPVQPPGILFAFEEVARRHGDFAICGVGANVHLDPSGRIEDASICMCGAGPTPLRAPEAEEMLEGEKPNEKLLRAVSERAAEEADPDEDVHATVEYRRELVRVLTRRALTKALSA
ncbi:MAG: FAD binding domain-containing protein [Nitrospinota bacterium]